MKRGLIDEQKLRERIAYIHGRVERELEAFAASLNVSPMELTHRVGYLLCGLGEGSEDPLPDVRLAPGQRGALMAAMESTQRPHGGGALSRPRAGGGQVNGSGKATTGATATGEVELTPIQRYWAQFTPEERSKLMKARVAKWSPEAKAKWKRGRSTTKGAKGVSKNGKILGRPKKPQPSASAPAS
jgi:hypothetical protein